MAIPMNTDISATDEMNLTVFAPLAEFMESALFSLSRYERMFGNLEIELSIFIFCFILFTIVALTIPKVSTSVFTSLVFPAAINKLENLIADHISNSSPMETCELMEYCKIALDEIRDNMSIFVLFVFFISLLFFMLSSTINYLLFMSLLLFNYIGLLNNVNDTAAITFMEFFGILITITVSGLALAFEEMRVFLSSLVLSIFGTWASYRLIAELYPENKVYAEEIIRDLKSLNFETISESTLVFASFVIGVMAVQYMLRLMISIAKDTKEVKQENMNEKHKKRDAHVVDVK